MRSSRPGADRPHARQLRPLRFFTSPFPRHGPPTSNQIFWHPPLAANPLQSHRSGFFKRLQAKFPFARIFPPGASTTTMNGGQGGIRTHGTVSSTHAFQACSFDHSDTCPSSGAGTLGSGRPIGNHFSDFVFPKVRPGQFARQRQFMTTSMSGWMLWWTGHPRAALSKTPRSG